MSQSEERRDDVSEADLLDQRRSVDVGADEPVPDDEVPSEADDADRLEQLTVVPDSGEDDRPRDDT
jgi:hypothetical protein